MNEQEIIGRIKELCDVRGWSLYRLAKESGITYSTLCTMLHKANAPSVPTLVRLCGGFGITLSEFFDHGAVPLTAQERKLLGAWRELSEDNRSAILKYLDFLLGQQG